MEKREKEENGREKRYKYRLATLTWPDYCFEQDCHWIQSEIRNLLLLPTMIKHKMIMMMVTYKTKDYFFFFYIFNTKLSPLTIQKVSISPYHSTVVISLHQTLALPRVQNNAHCSFKSIIKLPLFLFILRFDPA